MAHCRSRKKQQEDARSTSQQSHALAALALHFTSPFQIRVAHCRKPLRHTLQRECSTARWIREVPQLTQKELSHVPRSTPSSVRTTLPFCRLLLTSPSHTSQSSQCSNQNFQQHFSRRRPTAGYSSTLKKESYSSPSDPPTNPFLHTPFKNALAALALPYHYTPFYDPGGSQQKSCRKKPHILQRMRLYPMHHPHPISR